MNEIPKNPILEFNPNQLESVRKACNYVDKNRFNQDIQIFGDWIRKQNHFLVKEYDKEYLERYLICSKGSVERAKQRLDKLCTLRGLMPEYLRGFDIRNEFNDLLKTLYYCILPKPTPDNYRVMLSNVHNADEYEAFDSVQISRYLTVFQEYLYCHDYSVGLEIILDSRNYTFNIIKKINPVIIANIVLIMVEARGLRIKGIHLITGSKFLDTIVAILKQGLTKKLTSRFHVHDSLESLYKLVPRNILPKEYGGDEDTLKELSYRTFEEMASDKYIERMKFMESATTDESKRMSSEFNEVYSGMPGSFKSLRVD